MSASFGRLLRAWGLGDFLGALVVGGQLPERLGAVGIRSQARVKFATPQQKAVVLSKVDLPLVGPEMGDARQALFARYQGERVHGVVHALVPRKVVAVGEGTDLLLAVLEESLACGREV